MDRDKTKIVLLIGVPILVGSAAYYYYQLKSHKRRNSINAVKIEDPLKRALNLKESGNKHFSRKNYELAIEQYSLAIQLAKESSEEISASDLAIFFQNRAACFEALENYQEVVNDCHSAIEANKKYAKAYLRRAKAFKALKKYSEAISDAHVVNFLEEFQNQASLTLADLCAIELSKIQAAEAMKGREGSLWPTNQEVKNYFSSFIMDPINDLTEPPIKTVEQLQAIYAKVLNSGDTNDPLIKLADATCKVLLNKQEEAEKIFQELLDDKEVSERIKSNIILKKITLIMSDSANVDKFESVVDKINDLIYQAETLDKTNADIFMMKAKISLLSEKIDAAMIALNEAIKLKPDYFAAIAHRMYLESKMDYGSSQNTKEILVKFKKAIEQYPDSIDIRTIYMQLLLELNLFELADEELSKLADMCPNDIDVYITRALLLMQLGDMKKASSLLETAKSIDPRSKTVYDILGSIQVQQGKMDEAIKIYKLGLGCSRTSDELERFYTLLASCEGHLSAQEVIANIK